MTKQETFDKVWKWFITDGHGLGELQGAHDNSAGAHQFGSFALELRERLVRIALDHGLTVPAEPGRA